MVHMHRWSRENENHAYRTNRYDNTQNRFEYRRKGSIGTSSALARNETRLVSNETCIVSLGTSLERNETHLARRWWLTLEWYCIHWIALPTFRTTEARLVTPLTEKHYSRPPGTCYSQKKPLHSLRAYVYILSLHFVPSLQPTDCSLHFVLTICLL